MKQKIYKKLIGKIIKITKGNTVKISVKKYIKIKKYKKKLTKKFNYICNCNNTFIKINNIVECILTKKKSKKKYFKIIKIIK